MSDTTTPASTTIVNADTGLVQINNVTLGYRNLWTFGSYQGKTDSRHRASFVFRPEDKPAFAELSKLVLQVFKAVDPSVDSINAGEHQRFKTAEKNGVKEIILKTSNSAGYPARYFDSNGRPVSNPQDTDAETKMYPGCKVNAKIQFTATRTGTVTTLWPNLVAIQFAGHGTPFSGLDDAEVAEGFGKVDTVLDDDIQAPAAENPTGDDFEFLADDGGSSEETSELDLDSFDFD